MADLRWGFTQRIKDKLVARASKQSALGLVPLENERRFAHVLIRSGLTRYPVGIAGIVWAIGRYLDVAGRRCEAAEVYHRLTFSTDLAEARLVRALSVAQEVGHRDAVTRLLEQLLGKPLAGTGRRVSYWRSIRGLCMRMYREEHDALLARLILDYVLPRLDKESFDELRRPLWKFAERARQRGEPEISAKVLEHFLSVGGISVAVDPERARLEEKQPKSSVESELEFVLQLAEDCPQLDKKDKNDDLIIRVLPRVVECLERASGSLDSDSISPYTSRVARTCVEAFRITHNDSVVEVVDRVEKVAGHSVECALARAYMLKWCFRLEEAREAYRQALEHPECDPSAYFELAETLEWLEDDCGAIEAAKKGSDICDEEQLFLKKPGCLTQVAGPQLRQGDLISGWSTYMKRRDRYLLEVPPGRKIWKGEDIGRKSLLILAEKGIGDEIRYASCYRDLASRPGAVAVSSDPRLAPLLQRSFPKIQFVPAERNTEKSWKKRSIARTHFRLSRSMSLELYSLASQMDYTCMAGDLPLFFRRDRSAFPEHEGYLIPDPEKREIWRTRLAVLGCRPKVGVSWRSTNMSPRRRQHYFRIEELVSVLKTEGVDFINLQYDDCEEELTWLEQDKGIQIHRWWDADLTGDIDGMAALISELDLVISPHTMVKELAGAIGTPTLFMVPTGQAWVRWRMDTNTGTDIWYPSVQHIQSRRAGDKSEVVELTAYRLRKWLSGRGGRGTRMEAANLAEPSLHNRTMVPRAKERNDPAIETNRHGERFRRAGVADLPHKDGRIKEWSRRQAEFRDLANWLFMERSQPTQPQGAFFVCGMGSYKQIALTLIGMHALLKRGWCTVFLDDPLFEVDVPKQEDIAYFQSILITETARKLRHRESTQWEFRWEVDWQGKVCKALGINFYGIIANRLGKEFKQYAVDFSDSAVQARIETLLATCDAALKVCAELEEKLGPRDLPVRLTGFEPNYPPTGVFKLYCAERGYKYGIEFVEIRQAYEKYFRAGKSGFVSAIEVQNVTRYRLYSASGLRHDRFDKWLAEHRESSHLRTEGHRLATQDRAGRHSAPVTANITLDRIRRHREAGGRVACLYGCIPFDFGHPWVDHGPAHRDLRDWYNHTVATLADTDVLLLIKPHPSEADFAQFGRPNEFFVEMLDVPLPTNVGLIGHRWLNNAEIAPYLDYGIVWRGTIALELALMDVPVIVCAPYSMTDHVLAFPMPESRGHYESMIQHPEELHLSFELKERASMVFPYYRAECMIDYPFGWFPSKRKEMGPPVLSSSALKKYRESGHPSADRIATEIIDGD